MLDVNDVMQFVIRTHLGYTAKKAGIYVKSPVFEGFPESRIWAMMKENGLHSNGKSYLYDGRTEERFENLVVCGYLCVPVFLSRDNSCKRAYN